jgi:periplasmic protein TonB
MTAINKNTVISYNIQQDRFLKIKAFFISLFLHLLLLASLLQFEKQHLILPIQKINETEKSTQISLSAYKLITQEPLKTAKTLVQPQPKRVEIKKEVKKVIKETKVVKPIEEKTLQETQQKQAVVESLEAFTPQIPHTEQKDHPIQKQELAPQNSPLSEQKLSQLALIRSLIQNALRYPTIAKKLRIEGVVLVSFSLSTTGRISNLQLVQSSSSSVLDKRALQTVSSLDGEFPQLDKKVDLKIPIAFSLQQS